MSKYLFVPLLLFSLITNSLQAQEEKFFCMNPSDNPRLSGLVEGVEERGVAAVCDADVCKGLVVNLKFHVLHMDNGSGGYNSGDVAQCKTLLNNAFNPRGITFNYLPTHDWNNSFYLTCPDLAVLSIFSDGGNQRSSDAVHVYLVLNPGLGAGKADGIPSNACFLGGTATYNGNSFPLVPSHIVSHEVGHCMGLQHTFNNFVPGSTPATESNPCTMGDFVEDTPVDPVTTKACMLSNCGYQQVGSDCPKFDPSGVAYTPKLNNIMAYTLTTCMTEFTVGQGDKMREDAMAGLPGVFSVPDIVSQPNQSNMCPNQQHKLTLCFPGTVTWTVVPAGAVTFSPSNTGQTVTITPASWASGAVTIRATASNGQFKEIVKNITSGASIVGTYSNNFGPNLPMYTVNGVKAGSVYVTLTAPTSSTFTWTIQSGSCSNFFANSSGNYVSFNLNSGSVTFVITALPCGMSRTVTFFVSSWGLAVWPNPGSDQVFVAAGSTGTPLAVNEESDQAVAEGHLINDRATISEEMLPVEMRDALGTLVYNGNMVVGEAHRIDVSSLKPGLYWVSIKGDKDVKSQKVVISR
jgi:hypothetical protein